MRLSDFDYALPKELIAQYPAEARESSRMLVLDRREGSITHARFSDLSTYIRPGDVIILNDTKVVNARLRGKRATGGRVELFFLGPAGKGRFKVLIRPSKRIKEGEEIYLENAPLKVRLISKRSGGSIVEFLASAVVENILGKAGSVPLPPYIRREPEPLDKHRYQTVFAKNPGATAAPTAGLHFTNKTLDAIRSKGAKIAYVTLHVSYGTFAPVLSEDITRHRMHSETFKLSGKSAVDINSALSSGGRVIAVGTTSCRVLESCARDGKYRAVGEKEGDTDLFIYPGYAFRIVDVLLTNFHLPKSTLLMLVSAFAGRGSILKTYKEAIEERYRFFSYGDCMLII